eukprot:845726-Prorocentrum_minimum.AAC.1
MDSGEEDSEDEEEGWLEECLDEDGSDKEVTKNMRLGQCGGRGLCARYVRARLFSSGALAREEAGELTHIYGERLAV